MLVSFVWWGRAFLRILYYMDYIICKQFYFLRFDFLSSPPFLLPFSSPPSPPPPLSSHLNVLAKVTSTMFKRDEENRAEHICLFPHIWGKTLSLPPLSIILDVKFFLLFFGFLLYFKKDTIYSQFVVKYYCERVLNFFHKLFASNGILMWILSFLSLMWYITVIDFQIFNQPFIPGINYTWS